jgi:hypothetical protein
VARPKSDDKILKEAKQKLGKLIESATAIDDVVALCDSLVKIKEVEIQADEGGFGSALGNDT